MKISSQFDKEKAGNNLAVVTDKMRSETDPALLNEYRKLFKKNLSFFRRSWAAAWLLMYYDQKENPVKKQGLSEDTSVQLFISIGRNRRLFPKDILSLILSKTQLARDDIGIIKILDNYSFVQVRSTAADTIINAINGINFKGRIIAVNYAKPKNDETEKESG